MWDDLDILSDLEQLRSRYDVLRQLGHDGGCAVYAVRARDSDRHYVVKVMPKPGSGSAQAGTLHLWQAHTMERLDHPKLMVLHTVHHLQGGTLALAMERRRGRTLAERIEADGALSFAEVESVLRDVAEALAFLHARGVVHRGVNTDSILLDRDSGCGRLALFGIPPGGRAGETAPDDGASLGRAAAYEPPEQSGSGARLHTPDPGPWSDLYGLGVVGYAMLAGREPHVRPDGVDASAPRTAELLPPVETLRAEIPSHLRRAIEACLERDPRRRARSVDEFLALLDPAAEHAPAAKRTLRLPRFAFAVPAALFALVAWTVLRADDVTAPPAIDDRTVMNAEVGFVADSRSSSPEKAPAAIQTPPPVVADPAGAPSAEPEARRDPEPRPTTKGATSSSQARIPRSTPRRAVSRPAPASPAPVRRPAPSFLLGEEITSTDRAS